MGDSYREELKRTKKRSGFGPRDHGNREASEARSKAIKREQSLQTLRARAREKATQGRLGGPHAYLMG